MSKVKQNMAAKRNRARYKAEGRCVANKLRKKRKQYNKELKKSEKLLRKAFEELAPDTTMYEDLPTFEED